ncbi:MAG: hypothetical protein L3J03_10225 [Desulfobacterales bacterium]|nr:hypothetical protein [Desulfobacterales bacterium]
MAEEKQLPISGKSITVILICISGLLAFVLLALLPLQRSLDRMDREIAAKTAELKERKELFPVYQELIGRLRQKEEHGLPFPEPAALALEDLDGFLKNLRETMRGQGMEPLSMTPDFKSMPRDAKLLRVTALLRGGFPALRKILIELGREPALRHLEEIRINSAPGFKEFRLKFWLALQAR